MVFNLSGFGSLKNYFKDEFGVWIPLDDFYTLIKRNLLNTEKPLKKSNMVQYFKRNESSSKIVDDKLHVSSTAILKYIVYYCDQMTFCNELVSEIESKILNEDSTVTQKSIKDLYSKIATNLTYSSLDGFILDKLNIGATNTILSLYAPYENDFNEADWKKIYLFEYHYSHNNCKSGIIPGYETDLDNKYSYYRELHHAVTLSKKLKSLNTSVIHERTQRIQSSLLNESICLSMNDQRHNPAVLDSDLTDLIGDVAEWIICVDCVSSCQHPPSVHVYIELKNADIVDFNGIVRDIKVFLTKYHRLECYNIIFFKPEAMKPYLSKEETIVRFILRDDVMMKKLYEYKCYEYCEDGAFLPDVSVEKNISNCTQCFGSLKKNPLNWKSFSWLEEWSLQTPLEVQIIFGSFLSDKSVKESGNVETLLQKKVNKLYSAYDMLLNTRNRKYIGIFQLKNSHELSMNYQSLQTVFNVSSGAGSACSLSTAERKLKKEASSDMCYYNTYLKKYPLKYETSEGMATHYINLRCSLLVFMMDNLVRLKYHSDPCPGENRSMQMCTLPKTLIGIPVDDVNVLSWHADSCETASGSCSCMNDLKMGKGDVEKFLINLLPEEEEVFKRFQNMMTWGFPTIWHQITEDDWLDRHLLCSLSGDLLPQDSLEESFLNMTIEEESDNESSNNEQESKRIEINSSDSDTDDETKEEDNLQSIMDRTDGDISLSTDWSPLVDESTDSTVFNDVTYSLGERFGFFQHKPPPSVTRHPEPSTGRDDDIQKLKEILDDIIMKTERNTNSSCALKILFAPDNKIGKNLLKLIDQYPRFSVFLPEFPILHLRKSKINTLCTAYKDAGLIEILKYMKDEDFEEWKKLISAEHIDQASRYIRRIALSLHTAFLITFLQSLPEERKRCILESLLTGNTDNNSYQEYEAFLQRSKEINKTFLMHYELMEHCDEIVALTFSERLGGKDGYLLLLASVKSSLPFAYLNGASSYATFCTQLLHYHYKSGQFYKRFKENLYTTRYKNSDFNFGLDTIREMEHRDVLKSFRSGSTMTSVLPRMSLVDSTNELLESNNSSRKNTDTLTNDNDLLGLSLNSTDLVYIRRVTSLILRCGGLSSSIDETLHNVYSVLKQDLPQTTLDEKTYDIGKYLAIKYATSSLLFGSKPSDVPNIDGVKGPSELLVKVKKMKSVTMKRTSGKKATNKAQISNEQKRLKLVQKETKRITCMSSNMNACQAIVKPDCSKAKVAKSAGMKAAVKNVFSLCLATTGVDVDVDFVKLVKYDQRCVDSEISSLVRVACVEFAGVKFKSPSMTGYQYVKFAEKSVISNTLKQFPLLKRMALCEEKYSFTPDDFKAETRLQRVASKKFTINHLKTSDEILTPNVFDKTSLTQTHCGKQLISTYLASHIEEVEVNADIQIDIDSELNISKCKTFAIPIRCHFSSVNGFISKDELKTVKQSKGEAEMAQIDWLYEYASELSPGDACISVVTSGDIDAVVLHLFSLSLDWKRNTNRKFINPVIVLLQKPTGIFDIYNITGLIEYLEENTSDNNIGVKIAVALCLGGNDFFPKFYGISHSRLIEVIFTEQTIKDNFLNITQVDERKKVIIDKVVYKDIIKKLYCPKYLPYDKLSYEEVQQISVSVPRRDGKLVLRDPQRWMPPDSAIEALSKHANCLLEYFLTAGCHNAKMPNFLDSSCLKKNVNGKVQFCLGPDSQVKDANDLMRIPAEELLKKMAVLKKEIASTSQQKRKHDDTPQKGRRRKNGPKTSTPRKDRNCDVDISLKF